MTARTRQRRDLTRLGIGCGLFCLLIAVLTSALGHRDGNKYITFGTLWASGNAANNGLDPYAAYPETYQGKSDGNGSAAFPDLNFNPPWTIPSLQALSRLPLERFAQVWTLLTGVCLFAGCIILIVRHPELQARQVLWLSLCAPTLITISSGQVYGWPFLLGALAWLFCKDRRFIAAGIAVGVIVSLRPTMAPWILMLFLAGNRKIAVASFGTFLALYALPLAIYGPIIYVQWLHAVAGDKHWLDPLNISIPALLARHGHAPVGIAFAILIALAACGWALRKKPDFTTVSGAALCMAIVCAPLAWFHYVLFVAPFFMTRRWSTLAMCGACPLLIITLFSATTRGLIYLVATIAILCVFLFSNSTEGAAT
jgi:hypothetical protein